MERERGKRRERERERKKRERESKESDNQLNLKQSKLFPVSKKDRTQLDGDIFDLDKRRENFHFVRSEKRR